MIHIMNILLTSRIITGWVLGCCMLISYTVDTTNSFYNVGPSDNLTFIGITIDTEFKYACIIVYCLINTVIRSCSHNIVYPYITLNIQDPSNKNKVQNPHEIVTINILYYWFDWIIYINLLISQVDMIIIEMISEIIITNLITYKYIREKISQVI